MKTFSGETYYSPKISAEQTKQDTASVQYRLLSPCLATILNCRNTQVSTDLALRRQKLGKSEATLKWTPTNTRIQEFQARQGNVSRNVSSGEERGETNVFAGYKFNDKESAITDAETAKLLNKEVVVESAPLEGDFIFPIFLRLIKDGIDYKMILTLKEINNFVAYQHFKMDPLKCVTSLITQECYPPHKGCLLYRTSSSRAPKIFNIYMEGQIVSIYLPT